MLIMLFVAIILIMWCLNSPDYNNKTVDLNKIKKAKTFTVKAEVVDKYIADDMTYVVFKTDNEKLSLMVGSNIYGELSIGDIGELWYGIYKNVEIYGDFKQKDH